MSPFISQFDRDIIHKIFKDSGGDIDKFIEDLKLTYEQLGDDDGLIAYLFYLIGVRIYGNQKWKGMMNFPKTLMGVADQFMQDYVRPYEQKAKEHRGDVK